MLPAACCTHYSRCLLLEIQRGSHVEAAKPAIVQECTHRKVLHDDGRGRQLIEVDHKSGWRFMWQHGSFTTRLLVEQVDDVCTAMRHLCMLGCPLS